MKKSISVNDLNKALQSENPPLIFDVRKKPAYDSDPDTIPSARWQIHDEVNSWAKELSQDNRIVVYCVHGHAVSQNAAQALCDMGLDACYLEGGLADWTQAGLDITKN